MRLPILPQDQLPFLPGFTVFGEERMVVLTIQAPRGRAAS